MSLRGFVSNVAMTLSVAFGVVALATPAGALGQTCTWTGATGDTNFSTAGNWTSCGGAAPTNGDALVFDRASFGAGSISADMPGFYASSISVTGAGTSTPLFSGTLGISGTLNSGFALASNATLKLYGPSSLASGSLIYHPYVAGPATVETIDLGSHNFTSHGSVSGVEVLGSGTFTADGATGYATSSIDWSGFSGTLQALNGGAVELLPGTLPSANPININGGKLYFCGYDGASISNPLSVGGDQAINTGRACGTFSNLPLTAANVVYAGPITLTANTTVGGEGEFKVTGALSGAYTITQHPGTTGTIVIAASSNTSNTPNGSSASETITTAYDKQEPTTNISASGKNIAIVTGTYGELNLTDGAIVKGTGTFTGTANITGGIIAPGMSPGCLTFGNLSFIAGSYEFELGGTAACTEYDQIKVTDTAPNSLSFGTDAMIQTIRFNNYTPSQGQTFVIIDQAGSNPVVGTFKDLPEGATFEQNGIVFKVSYVGGDGNDVTLTVQNTPTVPDTGFILARLSPATIVVAMTIAALVLAVMGRRLQTSRR